jgi:hypothetical protein
VRILPSAWEEESFFLLSGREAVKVYERYMADRDLEGCVHCEGYEAP